MALKAGSAALIVLFLGHMTVRAEECGRDTLAGIVNEASAQLIALNDANKKRFHEKLQQLKTKSGWSEADFVARATPFIKDDKIAGFDAENRALLARVPELGGGTPVASLATAAPGLAVGADGRCGMVKELRQLMGAVVENSRSKWTYVFGKLDAALNTPAADTNSQ